MPYSQNADLPERVTNFLSENAQDIYRNAFNNAWGDDEDSENPQDDASREEAAHSVAWEAVKEAYDNSDNNKWQINQPAGTLAFAGLALLALSAAGAFLFLRSKSSRF